MPVRVFMHPTMQRIVERDHYATRIFWSKDMKEYLMRHYSNTLNDELAGCLGVSVRTLVRKARELGLQKDPSWMSKIIEERRMMAHAESKRKGYPGAFKKGQHASPATEFKKKANN